jgi:hypothetical protein
MSSRSRENVPDDQSLTSSSSVIASAAGGRRSRTQYPTPSASQRVLHGTVLGSCDEKEFGCELQVY